MLILYYPPIFCLSVRLWSNEVETCFLVVFSELKCVCYADWTNSICASLTAAKKSCTSTAQLSGVDVFSL